MSERPELTVREAGIIGGTYLRNSRAKSDPKYYQRIGAMGNQRFKEMLETEPGFRDKIVEFGRKGGETTHKNHPDHLSKQASEGGKKVREKYGSEHFRRAGKIGGTNRAKNAAAKKQAALEASLTEPKTS